MEIYTTAGLLEVTPLTDGKDHVNIYSKARTQLGQDLSNFSALGITHPEFGRFASLEAYWYWLATGKRFYELTRLTGVHAKRIGKSYPRVDNSNFQEEFTQGIHLRFQKHPGLYERFMACDLPFAHYYYFGAAENCKLMDSTSNRWVIDLYRELHSGSPLWVYEKDVV